MRIDKEEKKKIGNEKAKKRRRLPAVSKNKKMNKRNE